MADEDAQAQGSGEEGSSWWALDASSEPALAAPSFDAPLEWPETSAWEGSAPPELGGEAVDFGPGLDDAGDLNAGLLFPPVSNGEQPGSLADGDATRLGLEALPESLWAAGVPPHEHGLPAPHEDELAAPSALAVPDTLTAPTFYAEAESEGGGRSRRWLDIRHGKAPLVGLVCVVGVVLAATVLAVPRRDGRPTDSSQSRRPTGGDIAARGPEEVDPLPTTTVTSAPPATISLSDLVAAADTPGDPSGEGTAAAGGISPNRAAPARSATPPAGRGGGGGAGGGGGSTPPARPAATPAAAEPEPAPPSPPASSAPARDRTTATTRRSAPAPQHSVPTYTVPDTSSWTTPTSRPPSSGSRPSVRGYNDD